MLKKLLALTAFLLAMPFAGAVVASDQVVYHIDDSSLQATKAMRSIRNHLDTAPLTKVVVVTHADGVDFLLEDAKDAKNPNVDYGSMVSALKARGVRFEVCEITLTNRNLKRDQFILDAEFTPSGVVRLTELQTKQRYAYIKP
jgi:intracellular sulfur oxidation DsrE/DsrF family protein